LLLLLPSGVLVASESTTVRQVIRIGNGVEPKELDPNRVAGAPEGNILVNLFEGLVSRHPKTLKPVPGVAKRWKTSPDGLTWTFDLRTDAKWSNGDPVTASDFVYSWNRLLKPETASESAVLGFYIKNARAFHAGTLKAPAQLGVVATRPTQLVVTLEHPTPFFLQIIDHFALYPVHQKTIEAFGAAWTRPEHFVGNGAFRLESWGAYRNIVLKPNPFYWDKAHVTLVEAQFFPTDSVDTEEKMFRSGQLDITGGIPEEKIEFWKKDETGVFQSHLGNGISLYRINVTKAPLNDKRVRRALALAIDRKQLVKRVTKGDQKPLLSFTPDEFGYKPPTAVPADSSGVEEAKRLLAEAGYGPKKSFPPIEILVNKSDLHLKIAEAIQHMWKKNLGIEPTLNMEEWKVFLDSVQTKRYQICRTNWLMDYEDPEAYLENWLSDEPTNVTGFDSKEYDGLFREAIQEVDPKNRMAKFRKAETILLNEMPFIPLYVTRHYNLKQANVEGWYPNTQNYHPLKYVRMK